jgi:hypothetical protein
VDVDAILMILSFAQGPRILWTWWRMDPFRGAFGVIAHPAPIAADGIIMVLSIPLIANWATESCH